MYISKLIKKIFGTMRYGFHSNPVRDWGVILTFGAISFSIILVWNAWAFNTVVNGGVIGSSATSTTSDFNRKSLDSIRTILDNRATEDNKYKTDVYHFIDPSQ